jgi:hypothetical protein
MGCICLVIFWSAGENITIQDSAIPIHPCVLSWLVDTEWGLRGWLSMQGGTKRYGIGGLTTKPFLQMESVRLSAR